jgi:ADP-ribose pyrophosphatase YjhB (NUDIX family)
MKTINQISAGGIVYKGSKWLICQHSHHKGWVFPKGFVGDVNKGESNEAAALREVEEEGGVKAKIVNPEPIVSHYGYELEGILYKKTVLYFLMEYLSGDPKDHDWEMMNAKFVHEEDVVKILTYPSDIQAFTKIVQRL